MKPKNAVFFRQRTKRSFRNALLLSLIHIEIEMDGELFLFLLGTAVLVVALFQKMRRYLCAPYRNIPVLNQIPVSYKHLDVYKRQNRERWEREGRIAPPRKQDMEL